MKKKWYVSTSVDTTEYDPYNMSYRKGYGFPTEKEFDNREDALTAAKKEAKRKKEDVVIYTIDSVATFPIDDIKIEEAVL